MCVRGGTEEQDESRKNTTHRVAQPGLGKEMKRTSEGSHALLYSYKVQDTRGVGRAPRAIHVGH